MIELVSLLIFRHNALMNYLYIAIGLSILFSIIAMICGAISWHRKPEREATLYLLAAYVALILVACCVALPVEVGYKAAIIFGLLLILVAQLLEKVAQAPAVVAQAFDLIAVLLYAATFATLHPAKAPTPWILLLLMVGGVLYWGIWPKLAELDGTIALYAVALLLMSWQATEVLISEMALWSWLSFGSAIGFASIKLLQVIHHSYHVDRQPRGSGKVSNSTDRQSRLPQWLHRLMPSSTVQSRLTNWATQGQRIATWSIEWPKLPELAHSSLPTLPLFVLLCQWMLILSAWGPELVNLTAGVR